MALSEEELAGALAEFHAKLDRRGRPEDIGGDELIRFRFETGDGDSPYETEGLGFDQAFGRLPGFPGGVSDRVTGAAYFHPARQQWEDAGHLLDRFRAEVARDAEVISSVRLELAEKAAARASRKKTGKPVRE